MTLVTALASGTTGPTDRAAEAVRQSPPEDVLGTWFQAVFDTLDVPILLLSHSLRVAAVNRSAAQWSDELASQPRPGHGLQLASATDEAALRRAIRLALDRDRIEMLGVCESRRLCSAMVMPIRPVEEHPPRPELALLALRRERVAGSLSLHWFGRFHGLTAAEQQVLASLCLGKTAAEIAQSHGVALSTVRTQLASIRTKTTAPDIRSLIVQVALWPPLRARA